MKIDRRTLTKSLAMAAATLALPSWPASAAAARLPVNRVTRIRVFYPPNYNANGPQAFPQSNMVVLVDVPQPAAPRGGGGGFGGAAHSPAYFIKVSAQQDGTFTVTNTRNNFSKTYKPRS